jgi:hypothetical protein
MYFSWVEWNMDSHNFNMGLPIDQWGFNIETQLVFCERFAKIIRPKDKSTTQLNKDKRWLN